MRALCGAIITAGALLGLGLASIGVGTRYAKSDVPNEHYTEQYVHFWQMDAPLILVILILIGTLIIGLGIAILGLAYHHHRRHHEHLRSLGQPHDTGPRVTTG